MITSRLRKVFEDPNSADHCCYTEGVSGLSRRELQGTSRTHSHRKGLVATQATQAQNKKIPEKRDSCLIAHLQVLCYNGLNYRDSYGNATD